MAHKFQAIPCGHCGSEKLRFNVGFGASSVACCKCHAQGPTYRYKWQDFENPFRVVKAKTGAMNLWNQRAEVKS